METPGLSPWLLFLLCPRSHPRGLIQALEFKYQPPAQGSYVYVFSSGLSAEPLTPPSSRPLRLPRTFSPRFQLIGSESELLVSLGSSFSVGDHVCFFFFFLLLSHLQSDRNSSLALPSESVQNPHAPYTSLWLLPVLFRLGHSQTL